jgi:hypothetical protein
MKIIWELRLLALVCLLDLISTVWLLKTGRAIEANPVMEFYLARGGTLCFVAIKAFLFLAPLVVLEQIRKKRPQFIRMLFRTYLAAYVVLYCVGSWYVNTPPNTPAAVRIPAANHTVLNG